MGASGAFSLDQLMELAGLACAQTLATTYRKDVYPRVLVCCGPGNQGGDGLVAARHLGMFGYQPTIFMPKPGSKDIYERLQKQCENMKIPIIPPSNDIQELHNVLHVSDVILDAIFGFSFKPPIRSPFDEILPILNSVRLPIVSVDIPSGWDVEKGNIFGVGLRPNVLISLTAPKEGVMDFRGKHFLGGRFVSKTLAEKYQLNLPEYHGYDQIVELLSSEEAPEGSRY